MFFGLIDNSILAYGDYIYPDWTVYLGKAIAASSIIFIPGVAVVSLVNNRGNFKEVSRV